MDKLSAYSPYGNLLRKEDKKKLNAFLDKAYQQWELIYKASRDGFNSNTFHSRCNKKGPTITIIQSNKNYIFGGYTSIPWKSDGSYKSDSTAFLFTLTNPHNIPPTKYLIDSAHVGNAVYHNSDYGPTFGSGHDIYVANGSNGNNQSHTKFPSGYLDTTGKGNNTFTGEKQFTVSDIEVFQLT
ncbi:unnamed protein product [Rotaria sp. Silwood1]|nr:unnamed protein product [Rotaria sp. Silwood1]CAF1626192.1 unnamed protein product [Rotaria sp. Silwood1]CAF3749109.1 unnamed protein product [Rotaria sp. Silwood1]CAF3768038.1 unnamed protein product [Rotaria sp. Silwood1]CAF3792435.1 unnamed protein product [Rotaria sp. Silwood1]